MSDTLFKNRGFRHDYDAFMKVGYLDMQEVADTTRGRYTFDTVGAYGMAAAIDLFIDYAEDHRIAFDDQAQWDDVSDKLLGFRNDIFARYDEAKEDYRRRGLPYDVTIGNTRVGPRLCDLMLRMMSAIDALDNPPHPRAIVRFLEMPRYGGEDRRMRSPITGRRRGRW